MDRYEGLRYPSVPINRYARAVHGMTRESLSGKNFDITRIVDMLGRAEILISHNSSFDARMMRVVWPEILTKDWLCSKSGWPWPNLGNKKLDSVCQHFEIARPKIHTASGDCEALTAALLRYSGKTERSVPIWLSCSRGHLNDTSTIFLRSIIDLKERRPNCNLHILRVIAWAYGCSG